MKEIGFVCFGEVNTPYERLVLMHDEALETLKALGGNLLDWMASFNMELGAFQKNKGTWVTLWGLLNETTLSGINNRMDDQFSGDNLANFTTYVSELTAAIQNGADLSEDDLEDYLGNNLARMIGIEPTKPPATVEEAEAYLRQHGVQIAA